MMQSLTINPIKRINGRIKVPGSKSITNRALLLAALSKGTSTLKHCLHSEDTLRMQEALKRLGIMVTSVNDSIQIDGNAHAFTGEALGNDKVIFLGNAGTAMRPLVAALALSATTLIDVHGDERMGERPIGPLVDCLRALGARISYHKNEGFPPLRIHPYPSHDERKPDHITIDGSLSSQFVSALLMVAPLLRQPLRIELSRGAVSRPYIDLSLRIMASFGVSVTAVGNSFLVNADDTYQSPGDFEIEADASSASYFWAGAAIGGGTVMVEGIHAHSYQGDVKFCEYLAKMGAQIAYAKEGIAVTGSNLKGIDVDCNEIPDAAMTLAIVALFAKGPTTIRNIYNWRIKETDRLKAMACELQKVGAKVEEGRDYLVIHPPQALLPATIATYHDHRMAMCFALCALGGVPVTIQDPDCTNKTYPQFYRDFLGLTLNV